MDKLMFVLGLMGATAAVCSILVYSRMSGYLLPAFVAIVSSTVVNIAGWMLWGGLSLEGEGGGWWLALLILSITSWVVSLPVVLAVVVVVLVRRKRFAATMRATGVDARDV